MAYRDVTRDRPQAWPLVLRGDLQQASRVPELIHELGIERQVVILPTMALGLWLGNRLHHALSGRGVLRLIAALLLGNGVALIARALESFST